MFCNPPYGKGIAQWVKKAYEESKKPDTVVVMLIPSRTDTQWFHDWMYGKAELRFVKGRLKFVGAKYNAPFPSMVAIYRGETMQMETDEYKRIQANRKLMAKNVKVFRKEPKDQVSFRHRYWCPKCSHWTNDDTCNYILDTGHIRPCAGADCVEMGVFEPGKHKRNSDAWR